MVFTHITKALRLSSPATLPVRAGAGEATVRAAPQIIDARGAQARAVAHVERLLGYAFRDRRILEEALTHPSHPARPSYDRLLAAGRSALRRALADHHRGLADELLAAEMSPERLALVAVRHDLYRFMRRDAPELDQAVAGFAEVVERLEEVERLEDVIPRGGAVVEVPGVLGDVVKSVAGAVHVDCGCNGRVFWKVCREFLEPLVAYESGDQRMLDKKVTMKPRLY